MEQKYILALEIGSSKIKGAVGVLDDGILTVNAVEEEKLVDSVKHGLIINVENVATRVNSIIRKLENRVSPRKARSLYLGIGGRSFISSPREIERQLPVEEEITSELISQLRAEALATALPDREVVTVIDGEYLIDHHTCTDPVGTFGRNIRARYNLITCRQQVMRNIKRAITDRLNYKINDTFVRQIAEGELVLSNDERLQGCMLVDLGAETTTVSIYRNGALCYMATIPMGSRNITRDIMGVQPLEEKAESLKIAGGHAMPSATTKQTIDGFDFTEINNYVSARAVEIVANVAEQIRYAGLRPDQLPGGIILVGLGSKLRGLKELVEKITKIKKVHAGLPSGIVRIADSRLNAFDSIDVISTLYAASKLHDPVDCMIDATAAAKPAETAKSPEPQPVDEPEEEPGRSEEEPSSIVDDGVEIETLKHRNRKGLFNKIVNRINIMLTETDDEIEDE